jgi:Protein of unknown function (DUF664)
VWFNRRVDVSSLLLEMYSRVPPLAEAAVDGVAPERLTESPPPGANTIAWLIWHLARVQDHHVSELLEVPQLWVTGDWAGHFGLEPDAGNTGYGHTADQVIAVRPDRPGVLLEYLAATDERTRGFVEGLVADDLDRVVDRRWDPPVTLGVRLVSIADDCLQHAGQAAYVRGLLA